MDIKFSLEAGYYCAPDDQYITEICEDVLHDYFDLSDNPETVTFRVSPLKHDNAYYVEAKWFRENCYLFITLSDGSIAKEHIFPGIFTIIERFPDGCWVSIYD